MATGNRRTERKKRIVLIAMGDFNGIGPEVSLKAALSPQVRKFTIPVLVGSIEVFEYYARRLKMKLTLRHATGVNRRMPQTEAGVLPVLPIYESRVPRVEPGRERPSAGSFAGEAISQCVRLCLEGSADAFVTAPTSKDVMHSAGYPHTGQTELVASLSGRLSPTMILLAGSFRVALATAHVPLSKVAKSLSRSLILKKITAVHKSLKGDFGIGRPRIAVLGLNPHAGEKGLLGREEQKAIAPAVRSARRMNIRAEGPFPADGFFATHAHNNYDAVLAMYHDQGLIPLKMTGFDIGVNYSAGLRVVRTSPDHGTAFDIAGKGIAKEQSMIEAVLLAASIAERRQHDNS